MKVVVTPQAEKHLLRVSGNNKKKVEKKLLLLEFDPFIGKKISGEYKGLFSLRAWPYRIIYWINNKNKTIYIISILHRQGVYKRG